MAGNRTIPRLWRDSVARNTGTAYLVDEGDTWREVSWADAAERVELLANGLLARGVRKGDPFGILARTTLEWSLFDFALGHVGAIGVGIYANSSPRDVQYVLAHSEAVGVLCEDDAQRAKVEEGRAELPALREVLTFGDLAALEEDGRAHRAAHPSALDDAVAAIDEEDLFTFIYTSGTTGPPKGCMIRHRNYHAMVSVNDQLPDHGSADDVLLLYLPLAHNYGRLVHLSAPYVGYTTAFLSEPLEVARAMPQVRPTILPSVPRIYEKVHTAVTSTFAEATGTRRKLIDWALRVGRRASELQQQGKPVPRGLAMQVSLADRLVFSKVKERLGGRLRIPISGGAPLAKEVAEFFHAMGISIREGYGLTECTTAATTNRADRYRFGTVGPALPGFELRVAEDGELDDSQRDRLRRLLQGPGGDGSRARAGRLAPLGRHRDDRRRRLRHDHRPEEGHHRHGRREEHRAAEPRERPQDVALRLAGARRRRPAPVPRRADHARPGRDREMGGRARASTRTSRRSRATSASASSWPASSRTSTASAHASSRSSASRSSRATSRWSRAR